MAYLLLFWSQTSCLKFTLHTILHKLTQNLYFIPFPSSIWKICNFSFGELMIWLLILTVPVVYLLEAQWPGVLQHLISNQQPCWWKRNCKSWCGSVPGEFPYSFISCTFSLWSSLLIYKCFSLADQSWTELFPPNMAVDGCQKRIPLSPLGHTFLLLIFCQPFLVLFKLLITQ